MITSTLTTLGAFSPMMFWPGIMGEFMGYLPLTLIMALSASLYSWPWSSTRFSPPSYQKVKPLDANLKKKSPRFAGKRLTLTTR